MHKTCSDKIQRWYAEKNCMSNELALRNVVNDDLPIFFEHQLDQEANDMAAFTARDPTNAEAFMAHWGRILACEPTSYVQSGPSG